MSTITPTPGRMIWFQPRTEFGLGSPDLNAPMAAVVAAVNEDGTINLCAFGRSGHPLPQQSVPILELVVGQELPEEFVDGGFAYWMPYQIAAAAKSNDPVVSSATLTGVGAGGAKDPT